MVKLLPVEIPLEIKHYVIQRLRDCPFREVRLSFFWDDLDYVPDILQRFNLVEIRRSVPIGNPNAVRIYVERRD